jgi:hypothetical protein
MFNPNCLILELNDSTFQLQTFEFIKFKFKLYLIVRVYDLNEYEHLKIEKFYNSKV